MKNTLYIIFILTLFASCKTFKRLPDLHTPTTPFVLLKNGQRYTSNKAGEETKGLVTTKITLGDSTFDSKDVAIFSPGDFTYANIERASFAPQVASGKINVYRYQGASEDYVNSYNSNSSYSSESERSSATHHLGYYIQLSDTGAVKKLNYKNLLPMVPYGSPEYKQLKKYKKIKTINTILRYTATALLFGGGTWEQIDGSYVGAAMFGVGLAILIPSSRALSQNEEKIFGIVLSLDHYVPQKAFHKKAEAMHTQVNSTNTETAPPHHTQVK